MYYLIYIMLFGLFKIVILCVLDIPKVMHFSEDLIHDDNNIF